MFESSLNATIILCAVGLWFAQGWYLNERLKLVHEKLDRAFQALDGLREYLYEIDPQFDDERAARKELYEGQSMWAGYDDFKLLEAKERDGKRTLNTPFVR